MKLLFFFLSILLHLQVYSQVIVSWNTANPSSFTIGDMWKVSIVNLSSISTTGIVELKIETNDHVLVLTLKTASLNLAPGINLMSTIKETSRYSISYGNNKSSYSLQQTGQLPLGKYIFCASFESPLNLSVDEISCEERELGTISPPYLILPYNGSEVSTKYPLLVWHPPVPIDESKVTYALTLVPITYNQSPELAMKHCMPFIKEKTLNEKNLQYSARYPALEAGKSYAWKVDVYYQQQFIASTETWSFKVLNRDTLLQVDDAASFSMIDDQPDGGYYVSSDFLRLGYNNRSNDTGLKYRIIQADSREPVEHKQEIPLDRGINKIELNMKLGNFKKDTPYELTILDGYLNSHSVIFYYKERQN
jgi:hypothetical protein